MPFIASGFTPRFYLLCFDEWWVQRWYWELHSGPSAWTVLPSSCSLARRLLVDRRRCRQTRLSGHQVTMSGGSALQGTSVCFARAPIGARLPPLPAENLEISPPRRLIAPRIAYAQDPGRDTCAPGARPHPPRRSHHWPQSTSGCVQNPVWAGPGRRFVPVPRMSDIYISQQGLSRHKQPDELSAR